MKRIYSLLLAFVCVLGINAQTLMIEGKYVNSSQTLTDLGIVWNKEKRELKLNSVKLTSQVMIKDFGQLVTVIIQGNKGSINSSTNCFYISGNPVKFIGENLGTGDRARIALTSTYQNTKPICVNSNDSIFFENVIVDMEANKACVGTDASTVRIPKLKVHGARLLVKSNGTIDFTYGGIQNVDMLELAQRNYNEGGYIFSERGVAVYADKNMKINVQKRANYIKSSTGQSIYSNNSANLDIEGHTIDNEIPTLYVQQSSNFSYGAIMTAGNVVFKNLSAYLSGDNYAVYGSVASTLSYSSKMQAHCLEATANSSGCDAIMNIGGVDTGSNHDFVDSGVAYDAKSKAVRKDGATCGTVKIGYVSDYGLIIAGRVIRSNNRKNVFGDGTVSYNHQTGILSLKNANLTYKGIVLDSKRKGLIVSGTGTNNLVSQEDIAICLEGETTFTGGKFVVKSNADAALYQVAGRLEFKDADAELSGKTYGMLARVETANFSFNAIKSNLKISGQQGAIYKYVSATLTDCYLIAPANATFNASKYGFCVNNQLCTNIEISTQQIEKYDLYVLGSQVTSATASDILGNGTMSYNPSTKVLQIKSCNPAPTSVPVIDHAIPGLEIQYSGRSCFNVSAADHAMVFSESTKLSGASTGILEIVAKQTVSGIVQLGGTLTAEGGILDISAKTYALYGNGVGNLEFVNIQAQLTGRENSATAGFRSITLTDCYADYPHGSVFDSTFGGMSVDGQRNSTLQIKPGADPTGIENVTADDTQSPSYSVSGVRVGETYKGVVIRNGKKYIQK